MIVGVLSLQGDVPEHHRAVQVAAPRSVVRPVYGPLDLDGLDAVVIPGGESTTIADLMVRTGLWHPLSTQLRAGLPVLGTCAGLILLSKQVEPSAGGRDPPTFGVLDIAVRRNDYGHQSESFEAPVRMDGLNGRPFPGVFIRSPRIVRVEPTATPLAWCGSEVVGVRQGWAYGLCFHPELSGDPRVLQNFLALVRQRRPRK
ncbi:MAG: pyridoxal 5'-phosphate synthase glutaminase subunit PdxT [Thermoplasmata archaeon]